VSDLLHEIEALAVLAGVTVKDCGNGHIQLRLGKNLVNYYPNSPRKTAYNATTGERCHHYSPGQAIALCGSTTPRPPRVPKEPVESAVSEEWQTLTTNPAGIKNLYQGETPPWEFDTFICSQPDRLRIAAYKMRRKADGLEQAAAAMDPAELTALQKAAREMQQRHQRI